MHAMHATFGFRLVLCARHVHHFFVDSYSFLDFIESVARGEQIFRYRLIPTSLSSEWMLFIFSALQKSIFIERIEKLEFVAAIGSVKLGGLVFGFRSTYVRIRVPKKRVPSKKRRKHFENLYSTGELIQIIHEKASALEESIKDSEDDSNPVDSRDNANELNRELQNVLSR